MTRQVPPEPALTAPDAGARLGDDVAQMYDLLTCSLQAWSAYWTAWFAARGVDDLLRANAALASEAFSIVGLAAARRQTFHGRLAPTLNEP